ncbi:hypothetical protein [Azospirillum sp. SYSU D00513]|uniref:hypothetical protein n=1 Tax=Azospirillum sp. SYSU D00513 TaxID=2812561 RepID=UPI001A963544|nr:hypothetical protein [Azospirillum sp. SYSU D00513]
MRSLSRSLFLSLSLALAAVPALAPLTASPALAAPEAPSPEERQVTATFETARKALAAKRGSAVVPLLSEASVAKLEKVQAAARNPATRIDGLDPGEKFAVMGLRRYVSPAELRRMTLGDLADHAMKNGWLGPNAIARSALGPVRVRGDRASAILLVDNRPAMVPADFVREGGVWRIDLTNVFSYGGQMLQGFAAMSGKTEEAFITGLLERLPGKPAMAPTGK